MQATAQLCRAYFGAIWDLKFTSKLHKMDSRAPAAAPVSDVQQMQLWALAST